ncbi:hypothetical protein DL89DRAFT_295779 [Linderina pennispora]|uniref:Uncharacterized protein n=1 Tax=Linderina pennispora TaxID=61395 RepID=A0A1Y1VXA7_9FUNG|nr:uncharacterized protein DL89DRAFT_295779 [Linderina pennispora]ORX65900.1 hypothetical protein DL89DRAFT_295779 [Linderina pennispora]
MQHVPEHILSTIISYATGCTKYRAHLLTAEPPVFHRRLYPFLQLSRAWRHAACTYQYKIATLGIFPTSPHEPQYLSLLQTRQVDAEQFIRHIYITMTCQQVIDGRASNALQQVFNNGPLLCAKQLVLRILPVSTLGDHACQETRTIMISFTSFSFNVHPLLMVEHFCRPFENLRGIAVHANNTGPFMCPGSTVDFQLDNKMFTATLDNRLRVDYPNLSRLDIRTERLGLPFADQLVHKGHPFERLDTTQCWVGTGHHEDSIARPCIEVRTLKLSIDCCLFPEFIRCGLLNWKACQNLATIKFRVYMANSSQSFVAQMLAGIINGCPRAENLHCWDFCTNVSQWLPHIQPNLTIQRLEIPNIYCYLSEVGILLQQLPALRALAVSMHKIPSIKPLPDVLTDAEIAGVHMLMANAHSTKLQELTLGGMKFSSDERAGDIAVALASVCRMLKFLTIDFFFSANANAVYLSAKRATQRLIYTQTSHLHSLVIRNISK